MLNVVGFRMSMLAVALVASLLVGCARTPTVTVRNQSLAEVDGRIFGQFLERASWGEPGPEAFVNPETGRLPEEIVALMEAMHIPLLRFPGGGDVARTDWRDLISNAPHREDPDRPVTHVGDNRIANRFGLEEFFVLCGQLDAEPLLVVKVRSAIRRRETLKDVAYQAAALVAYCNAPVGRDLPADLERYADARAQNGHPEPHNVKLWQAGNELWMIQSTVQKDETLGLDTDEKVARRYIECLTTIIDAMKAVDPNITVLCDGPNRPDCPLSIVAADADIQRRVDIYTDHCYAPGAMKKKHSPTDANNWGDEDYWRVWATMPGQYGPRGQSQARRKRYLTFAGLGKPSGVTEWNWNGWGEKRLEPRPGFDPLWAAGLGASGFIHGMLRNAGSVKLANQSLLLGHNWGITAIRADPTGNTPPGYLPQGLAMLLHARHHGARLLASETAHIETQQQTRKIGWGKPPGTVALLDVLATGNADGVVYLHVINRSWDRDLPLRVVLEGFGREIATVRRFGWQANPSKDMPVVRDVTSITEGEPIDLPAGNPVLAVPARSMNVYVLK